MVRRLLATGLFALALAAPAAAQPRVLWPGVTFDTGVQFTPNGPVAINILTGPRPGGTTTLAPSLSNNTLIGRETLTAIERRTAPQATTAGINGDFFAFADGLPSGVLMQDGQVMSPPSAYRASAGVTSDGTLDVRRVSLSGTWQGARRQAHAEPVQQAARQEGRHRALHRRCGGRPRRRRPAPCRRSCSRFRQRPRTPISRLRSSSSARAALRSRSRPVVPFSSRSAPQLQRSRRRRPSTSSSRCSSPSSPTGRTSSPRSAAARRSSATAPRSSGRARSSRRASSARARRGAPSASSPTARWSSSRSTAASPGTRSG